MLVLTNTEIIIAKGKGFPVISYFIRTDSRYIDRVIQITLYWLIFELMIYYNHCKKIMKISKIDGQIRTLVNRFAPDMQNTIRGKAWFQIEKQQKKNWKQQAN